VVDEDGKAIYQKAGISHGRFSFTTPSAGGSNYEDDYYDYEADDYGASGHSNMKYEVCFSNVPKGGGDTKQKRKVAFKVSRGLQSCWTVMVFRESAHERSTCRTVDFERSNDY